MKKPILKVNKSPSELITARIGELADWRGKLFAQLLEFIRNTNPEIVEEWKWNTAVWSHNGLVCGVAAFQG